MDLEGRFRAVLPGPMSREVVGGKACFICKPFEEATDKAVLFKRFPVASNPLLLLSVHFLHLLISVL